MTKKYRIKKEYLRDDGCFAFGGSPEAESEVPDYLKAAMQNGVQIDMPQPVPTESSMPTARSVNPISMFAPPTPVPLPEAAPELNIAMPDTAAPSVAMPMTSPMSNIPGLLRQEGAEQAKLADAQATILQNQQREIADSQARMQQLNQQFSQDAANLATEIKNNPIDAGRYFNSKSSLGQVSTAIGLILGGIGGGLNRTGQNVALDFLNKNIDRDIEAQKAQKQNQTSLLNQLTQRYGSEQNAESMLRAGLLSKTQAELAEAASRAASPMARINAEKAAAALDMQKQALMAPVIKQQMTYDAIRQGATPEQLLRMGADPKLISEQLVPGMGLAGSAEDKKKLVELQEVMAPLKQNVARLSSLGPAALVPLTEANKQAKALAKQIVLDVKSERIGQLGVLSGPDMEVVESMISDPTAFSSLVNGNVANNQLMQYLNNKEASAAKSRLAVPMGQSRKQPSEVKIQFTPKK